MPTFANLPGATVEITDQGLRISRPPSGPRVMLLGITTSTNSDAAPFVPYSVANASFTTAYVNFKNADGTVSELIYYSDSSAFHDAHEEEIWQMVWESAEEHGQTVLEFLATLRGGHVGSMYQLKNLLAWFAVEETCYHMVEAESE